MFCTCLGKFTYILTHLYGCFISSFDSNKKCSIDACVQWLHERKGHVRVVGGSEVVCVLRSHTNVTFQQIKAIHRNIRFVFLLSLPRLTHYNTQLFKRLFPAT